MGDRARCIRIGWRAKFGLLWLSIAVAGCGGGQAATPEAVQAARQLWARAGIHDYDLDWSVRGPNNAHYFVTVRGGEVRRIESVRADGSKVPLHSAEARMFGVDGLFRTIDEELAVCSKAERPFGQPKGTRVVMRFEPDAKAGYPHWYHRDVLGSTMSVAIDVNAMTPATGAPGSDAVATPE
jgi:hypothetical protein